MAIIPKGIQFRMVVDTQPVIKGLYKTVEGMKGIRKYVADSLFQQSNRVRREIQNNVLDRIMAELSPKAKRSVLRKATVPFVRKINQYDADYGVYFDYREFPGIATIVGDEPITITPKKGKYLTVPNYIGEVDARGKHLDDYPGILFNPMVKGGGGRYRRDRTPARRYKAVDGPKKYQASGSAGTPYWYLKEGKERKVIFWALTSVTIEPKVDPEDLRTLIYENLSKTMTDLADKATRRFLREYK